MKAAPGFHRKVLVGFKLTHHPFFIRRAVATGVLALGANCTFASPPDVDLSQPPPRRRFTLSATGDIIIHTPVARRALENGGGARYSFGPMFAEVRKSISRADLAICHLEGTLSPQDGWVSGDRIFAYPAALAPDLRKTGYDACSTASNHSLDTGAAGVASTLDLLDRAGIQHAGTARSPEEAGRTSLFNAGGVRVGHLSYTYGLGLRAPQPWMTNIIDTGRIVADAGAARRRGAEFVVVSLHWGSEYQSQPSQTQYAVSSELMASKSVDLILGHHAHVVQPITRVGRRYVAFGMGNFLSNQSASCCPEETRDGVILTFSVEARHPGFAVTRVSFSPTWVEIPTYRILPVDTFMNDSSVSPSTRAALIESRLRTSAALKSLGARIVEEGRPSGG